MQRDLLPPEMRNLQIKSIIDLHHEDLQGGGLLLQFEGDKTMLLEFTELGIWISNQTLNSDGSVTPSEDVQRLLTHMKENGDL